MTSEQWSAVGRIGRLDRDIESSVRVFRGDVYAAVCRPDSEDLGSTFVVRIDPDGYEHYVGEGRDLPDRGVSLSAHEASEGIADPAVRERCIR